MTREVPIEDVFAAEVPQALDPTDLSDVIPALSGLAYGYVLAQWRDASNRPIAIRNLIANWLITDKVQEVEEFQPAHDCAACRAGNDQLVTFLQKNPGRHVALANLHYIEVWES